MGRHWDNGGHQSREAQRRSWHWDQRGLRPVSTGMGSTGDPSGDATAAPGKEEHWDTCPLLLRPTEPPLADSRYPQLPAAFPALGNAPCRAGSIPHSAGTGTSSRTAPCHELLRQVEHRLGPVPPSSSHGWDGRLRFLPSRGGARRPLDRDVSTGKPLRGGAGTGNEQQRPQP